MVFDLVLDIGEFEIRICFVLALWNSAMRTRRRRDSIGQGFRIANLVVALSALRFVFPFGVETVVRSVWIGGKPLT